MQLDLQDVQRKAWVRVCTGESRENFSIPGVTRQQVCPSLQPKHVRSGYSHAATRDGQHGHTHLHVYILEKSHLAAPLHPKLTASPPNSTLLVPLLWQLQQPRRRQVWSQKRCYLLGYERRTLGPEAQQFLRRGESQEGGDVCGRWGGQHGSWFLRDGRHR